MLFIQTAQRQFKPFNLILGAKIQDYFQNFDFSQEEIDRVYNIMRGSEPIEMKEDDFTSLFLPILYYVSSKNQDAIQVYKNKYLQNQFMERDMEPLKKLCIIFNIIEYEKKFKIRNHSQLNELNDKLLSLRDTKRSFEIFILYKYYSALLMYLLGEYDKAKTFSFEIVVDVKEELKGSEKSNMIKYIQVVNSLLNIKILESEGKEKNKAEILNCLECLYEGAKTHKEEMAIKLGLKIFKLQASNMDYVNCIKILEEILKILHKEMLFGRSHKNIVEQYLHVSGLLAYYNVLIGNFKEVNRFSKKISKSIKIISDCNSRHQSMNENSQWDEGLVPKYDFFQNILNSIVQQQSDNKDENNTNINSLISNFNKMNIDSSFKDSENMILNAYILDKKKNDKKIENKYNEYLNNFKSLLEHETQIEDSQILGFYFYLYNSLLISYNEYINDKSKKGILEKLRENSINLISFSSRMTPNNIHLQNLFRANYFKDMFNRLFFFYIFSFYAEKNYEKAIELYDSYISLYKVQFELTVDKGFYSIKKLRADSLFKLKKFREAATEYQQILGNVKDIGTIYFNLGICYLMLKEVSNAREFLELSIEQYKDNHKKTQMIQQILQSIQ